jgi:hypothetical protein
MNLLHCGQGFGKTHLQGIISAFLIQRCPDAMGFIGANTDKQLSDSTLLRVFDVWKNYFGWYEYTKGNQDGEFVIDKEPPTHFKAHGYTFKSNQGKIFFKNGAVIMTSSLENYKALDGREFSWAILDETKDTREVAIKDVILARLRAGGVFKMKDFDPSADLFGFTGRTDDRACDQINPVWIFTSPAKEAWLSEMFHLEKYRDDIERTIFLPDEYFYSTHNDTAVVIASAYWNQKNLPVNYITSKTGYLSKDRVDMLVFGSPFGKTGVEYYSNFNRQKHVKKCSFVLNHPIHLCWDFNVNPYMTLVVCQIIHIDNRIKLRIVKEFCLASPKNTIEAVCREFIDDYEHLTNAGVYIYGDSTGKNTLPIEDAKSFYKVVEKALYHLLQSDSMRLLKKNVNHRSAGKNTLGRRDFMNKLLSGAMGVDVEIDPSCKTVIADFEHVKEDANGAKDKKKEKINGIMCEPYGHTSDAIDGLACYLYY